MAVGLLQDLPEPHNWTHDYESIFWLLLWICAGSPVFGDGELTHDDNLKVLSLFRVQSKQLMHMTKQSFLYGGLFHRDARITHPYFDSLAPCLRRLQQLFYLHRLQQLFYLHHLTQVDSRSMPLNRLAFRTALVKSITELKGVTFDKILQTESLANEDLCYRPKMKDVNVSKYQLKTTGTSSSTTGSRSTLGKRATAEHEEDARNAITKKVNTGVDVVV
jgi:hypothetical protein